MMFIPVALALLDFAPVFFLSLGLFFLAQLVERLDPRCRRMALAGFALVMLGGLARAASNLALAISGESIPVLSTTLYVFCGPGFTLMGAALIRGRATTLGRRVVRDPWFAPTAFSWLVLLLAFYLNATTEGDAWKGALLGLGLAGCIATVFAAASLGLRRQLHMAAALFLLNLIGISAVLGLQILVDQNLWTQLVGELLSLAAEAAFAFAAWRVAAEYHARIGPTAATR
ncbi:MAG: hypothetical protein JJE39_02915 [Vicinamibacteria bacterium]|nr:hypothetical protein [Vicinamibacteria bacterium]